jgi:DNA gyrase subunit A
MERRWPAEEILPFIKLIDDPTHTANEDGTYNLSETRPARSSTCGSSA